MIKLIKNNNLTKEKRELFMKTHSRMLRGYDNNRDSIDWSRERHTAPSAQRNNGKKMNKVFIALSDPSRYQIPKVPHVYRRKTND